MINRFLWNDGDIVILDNKDKIVNDQKPPKKIIDLKERFHKVGIDPYHDEKGRFDFGPGGGAAVNPYKKGTAEAFQFETGQKFAQLGKDPTGFGFANKEAFKQGFEGSSLEPPSPKPAPSPLPSSDDDLPVGKSSGATSKAMSDQVKIADDVKPSFAKNIRDGVASIPEDDAKILIGKTPISVEKYLSQGGDYSASSGYGTQGAFIYRPGETTGRIRLGQSIKNSYIDRSGNRVYYDSNFANESHTVVHELGHALDLSTGSKLGNLLSSSIEKDSKGMTKKERSNAAHFLSNPKEMFAELYATIYSPDRRGKTVFGGMKPKRARYIFKKSINKLLEL